MQEALDSTGSVEPESRAPDASYPDPEADADSDPTTALVEVIPGVVVVFGDVPEALQLDLIDFGLVPSTDRALLTTTLASIVGNSAAVGGNLANAMSSAQGLYQVSTATQALLDSGAVLAAKDGANLGSMWMNGKLVAQARFIPVSAVTAASAAAAIGPAVAMIAIQMQLNQITGLVRTSIAISEQTLAEIRRGQWSELTGYLATIDRAVNRARELRSVPRSLWEDVAGNGTALDKQLDLYRRNVGEHVKKIERLDTSARSKYLDTNAESIIFDSHALMSSLKAWTGYQALHAGRARTAGAEDPEEARLFEIIVRDTQHEFEPALAEATRLVDALTRELQIVATLPGRKTMPLSGRRRDARSARHTSTELLQRIEPLANALRRPTPPLGAPEVVCALGDLNLEPYLHALRLCIERDEALRCLAVCHQRDDHDVVKAVGQNVRSRVDPEGSATVVAVTDRRILTTTANALLQEALLGQQIPLDDVRYVRVRTPKSDGLRSEVDLVTRHFDLRWDFDAGIADQKILALTAVLAESMRLPDSERTDLTQPCAKITDSETLPTVERVTSVVTGSDDSNDTAE